MRRRPSLILTSEPAVSELAKTWWLGRAIELALTESIDTGWATSATSLDPPGDELVVHRRRRSRYGDSIAGEVADCLFLVQLHRGKLDVEVAGPDAEAAARGLEAVRRAFPRQGVDAGARTVPVNFWHRQEFGEDGDRREMELVAWDEVAGNDAPAARLEMERLVRGYRPGAGGRLFLWHGPPGTGKTYALRALAWEWRAWCRLHYVMDPEALLGSNPSYLMEVISSDPDEERRPPWRLVALEDTGELLAPDARTRVGQGLSRLLNVADGMMGQGLRVLFLITTNEPLAHIHPAVARPGRCASQIEFAPLDAEDARRWLVARGRQDLVDEVAGQVTLAELHALADGRVRAPENVDVGFRP